MNTFRQRFLKIAAAVLVLCLAFGVLGATPRTRSDVEESALLSAEYSQTDERQTATNEASEQPELRVTNIAVPEVEEDGDFSAPAESCYCNRAYAGSYRFYEGELYVCAQDVFSALDSSARFSEQDDMLTVQAGDITVQAEYGQDYFISNNRYLYAPAGVIKADDGVYLPAESVARCFGGTLELDEENERLNIIANHVEPLQDGNEFYNEDDVYWLSHIIYSEAGAESFMGQIAVGNVVMNRVSNAYFKEATIKDVIFAEGQFDPVANGSIDLTPSDSAVAAAKVALEGDMVVSEDTLFFAVFQFPGAYVCTGWIGNHCFMALA